MGAAMHDEDVTDTSIRVSEELADELYRRKGRATSYEEFLWELLDRIDELEGEAEESDSVAASPSNRAAEDTRAKPESQSEKQSEPSNVRELLEDALPGSGDKLDARVDAVLRMYDLLQQREGEKVRTQDLKDLVDADDVEYSTVDSFWTNAVKKNKAQGRPNAVTLLPGVEALGNGRYRYGGGDDE